MDIVAAGVPEGRYERSQRQYRARVQARYAALRLANSNRQRRARLRALRRLHDGAPPRRSRRPALVLAVVFLALVLALVLVARAASGPVSPATRADAGQGPSGISLQFRTGNARPEGPSRQAAYAQGSSPQDGHRIRSIRSAICSVFTGSRCGPAIRVARCESRLYPRAVGSAGERGLFQIHPVHFRTFSARRLFEVLYNVRAAFRLSRGGRDWSPWTCRP